MTSRQDERKKNREEAYFRRFMSLANWDAVVESVGESPDFIVRMAGASVGVEVTELFKGAEPATGSAAKRAESVRARFMRDLAEEYYRHSGKPALVKALWPGGRQHGPSDDIAARLMQERERLSDWEVVRVDIGASEAYYITALPAEADAYKWRWLCASDYAGSPGAITEAALGACLEAKRRKLATYRSKAERTVLLIVADHLTNAGRQYLSPDCTAIDARGFDEVHLLMYPSSTQRMDRAAAF